MASTRQAGEGNASSARSRGGPGWHRFGFWTAAFTFLALLAFSTVPSPLYGLYAGRDGFSPFMITLVYAAYTLGVAASLFLAGHLSDTHGRRPLLLGALALAAASAVVFLAWPALPGLFVARVVTGLAVGVTSSTATAYLTELHLARRPGALPARAQLIASSANVGGLGAGALAAGLLAQYAGRPLIVPYVVFLVVLGVAAAGILLAPETRHRPSPVPPYRPQRLSAPPQARPQFLAALAGVVVAFAVLGMFVGLAGTFLADTLHRTSLALAGATVFLVFLAGVAVLAGTRTWPVRRTLLLGIALMLADLVLMVIAAWLPAPSLAVFLASGAIVGGGGCAVFKSALGVVVGISPPERLAESLATFFLAGYAGLSVPVIGLGIVLRYASTRATLLGFAIVIGAGIVAAAPTLLGYEQGNGEKATARLKSY